MSNFSENIFEAVDTIVQRRLNEIAYDITKEFTIVDNSSREEGKYVVSDGSIQFIAYSENKKYKKDDIVYITIPNGDFSQQKFIIGQKLTASDQTSIYLSPFDNLIDVYHVVENSPEEYGLIAQNEDKTNIEILNQIDLKHSGYTRLGLAADFKSLLKDFNVISGDYGLRATLNNEFIVDLNTADMIGNPYQFNTYYSQEQVFDISEINTITSIRLEFYHNNDFNTTNGGLVYEGPVLNNLFVKNIKLYLGYEIQAETDNELRLFSPDGNAYSDNLTNKIINLRWIHKEADGKYKVYSSVEDAAALGDYELRWYHYELGASSADVYSGVYWTVINQNDDKTYEKDFTRSVVVDNTLETEKFKVILLYQGKIIKSQELILTNNKDVVADKIETTVNTTINSDETKRAFVTYLEQDDYTIQINQSITKANEEANEAKSVAEEAKKSVEEVEKTVSVGDRLRIVCEDGTEGNYRIYQLGNRLINDAEAHKKRILKLEFFNIENEEWVDLVLNEEDIEPHWVLNGTNTMIKNLTPIESSVNASYYIDNYYSANKNNNIITCSITKDGLYYSASKELIFGIAGTTGTDATLIVDFYSDSGAPPTAINISELGKAYQLVARLYDAENNEVDLSQHEFTWAWSWFSKEETAEGGLGFNSTNSYLTELIASDTIDINNLYIAQVTCSGWGDYDLIAYCPIPLTVDDNYRYIEGAKEVIYDSSGSPSYYKGPYKMVGVQEDNGVGYLDGDWSIFPTASLGVGALKNTNSGTILSPSSFFIEGADTYGVQFLINEQVKWTQPILITQNKYPVAALNKWQGELVVDSENNIIMSSTIAAGKKDDNNTFTGVIMGSISKAEDSVSAQTGIYGYSKGIMTYAFKEDGTAFIGSGGGRIEFNADGAGIIKSGNYEKDTDGMLIDLQNGILKAANTDETTRITYQITLDATAKQQGGYPLQIGDAFKVAWDGSGEFDGTIKAHQFQLKFWDNDLYYIYMQASSHSVNINNTTTVVYPTIVFSEANPQARPSGFTEGFKLDLTSNCLLNGDFTLVTDVAYNAERLPTLKEYIKMVMAGQVP